MTKPTNRAAMLAVLAGTILTAAQAAAQVSSESQADGRCMAAFITMSDTAAAADKPALDGGMMFFMGKIVGRAGKAALAAAVGAGGATMADKDAPAIVEKCAAEFEAAANAM